MAERTCKVSMELEKSPSNKLGPMFLESLYIRRPKFNLESLTLIN